MSIRVPLAWALLALVPLAATACLSPGGPRPLRYYRIQEELEPTASAPATGAELRVRHASAAGHLRERMAVRSSPVRVELLELERWTEPPLGYVRRALERELFGAEGLRRTEALGAPALDLMLLAFEEVQGAPPQAEVVFTIALQDGGGGALLESTVVARAPLEGEGPEALARALSAALDDAARRAASAVAGALP